MPSTSWFCLIAPARGSIKSVSVYVLLKWMMECEKEGECPATPTPRPSPQQLRQSEPPNATSRSTEMTARAPSFRNFFLMGNRILRLLRGSLPRLLGDKLGLN
uniref:Uncharacterized protein n=1 Tax=Oryzias latipes TaxID=8090 RepID=A0A3P9LTH8_ORYLA